MIFTDEEDFEAEGATVVFTPGETRKCESFNIVNDDVMEDLEEGFTVVIAEVSPSSVVIGISQTTVTILDDDGKFLTHVFTCTYGLG